MCVLKDLEWWSERVQFGEAPAPYRRLYRRRLIAFATVRGNRLVTITPAGRAALKAEKE